MGDKGTKKTNKMLETQTNKANTYADKLGGAGDQERQFQTGLRSDILNKYNDLYSGVGSDSGGGGGGYTSPAISTLPTTKLTYADPRFNEAREGFKNFADTGGFTPGESADFRARGTATLPAFYEGLKTQMGAANRAAGGNVGFNSQMSKLAREQAYGGQRVASETEADLADRIRSGKEYGLSGVSSLDESKIGRETDVEKERNAEQLRQNEEARNEQLRQEQYAQQSAANANAGRNRNAERDFSERMAILDAQRGLRGEQGTDLPYYNQELAGINSGTNATANRVQEQSWVDSATGLIGAIAPAAAAAFTGGASAILPALAGGISGKGNAARNASTNQIANTATGGGGFNIPQITDPNQRRNFLGV